MSEILPAVSIETLARLRGRTVEEKATYTTRLLQAEDAERAVRNAGEAIDFERRQAQAIADAVLHVICTCFHEASECAVRSGLQQAYERLDGAK